MRMISIFAIALATILVTLAGGGCTPVDKTVSYPLSNKDQASARSLQHGTIYDDGKKLTGTNPNGTNYTLMDDRGFYSNQVLSHGAAGIGSKGLFALDPKNTSADTVEITFDSTEVARIFYDEEGNPFTVEGATEIIATPNRVHVVGFNGDLADVYSAYRDLAEVEAQKFAAAEESEQAIMLAEINGRGALYQSIFAQAVQAIGLPIPTGLGQTE